MKISGFTIIRNAIINDYPIVEAIKSVLPLVDEMVVLVGDSEDATEDLIRSIGDPKIRIHHSIWDLSLRTGGRVLAVETNKSFQLISPDSTWAFYIQADEAVHEKYYDAIKKACIQYKDDLRVDGLLFKYLHFYGTYDYVGDSRKWYLNEVRIIRNKSSISSYRDAQGFRIGNEKIAVKRIDASIYHYGWVKNPQLMKDKQKNVGQFWFDDGSLQQYVKEVEFFDYSGFDSLCKFSGTHPKVMAERIALKNWEVQVDLSKKRLSAKDRLLYKFEKLTGIRPFEFRNYRIV